MSRARRPEKIEEYAAALELPPFPMPLLYLWNSYMRIRRRKGGNGFSAMPIEWTDIDAFARRSGTALVVWEIEMIERLDDLFLAARSS